MGMDPGLTDGEAGDLNEAHLGSTLRVLVQMAYRKAFMATKAGRLKVFRVRSHSFLSVELTIGDDHRCNRVNVLIIRRRS